ncbi:hypothetical protein JNJ66_06065 [Candidatus Saccharibacteria bacterium]|nr:hypothetical protein [Candidatus Saccharibacteria bacterium]
MTEAPTQPAPTRRTFVAAVRAAVTEYVASAPTHDEGLGVTVIREPRVTLHREGLGVRVVCPVLHCKDEFDAGTYNREWTYGLLLELTRDLQAKGYQVSEVIIDEVTDLPDGIDVSLPDAA